MEQPGRHWGYDNAKGILIILVVLGHFLEIGRQNEMKGAVYLVIYSFHMPAFLFFSGFFAKYHPSRILYLAFQYAAFQLLYSLFNGIILKSSSAWDFLRNLTVPYWLLWYLPVLLYCHLLLPLWTRRSRKQQAVIWIVSVGECLLCGYCDWIGYSFSISRFLVFLPFFLLGNMMGNISPDKLRSLASGKYLLLFLVCIVLTKTICLLCSRPFTAQMLYGTYSYAIGYHPGIRLQIIFIALGWISLLTVLANTLLFQRIPILTHLGQNTLPVYLLHGFIVKWVAQQHFSVPFPAALFWTAGTITLLANPIICKLFSTLRPSTHRKRHQIKSGA